MLATIMPIAVLLILAILLTIWVDREERRKLESAAEMTIKNTEFVRAATLPPSHDHYALDEAALSPLLVPDQFPEKSAGAKPTVVGRTELPKREPEKDLTHRRPVVNAERLSDRANV